MIVGIGIDLVEVERIEALLEKHGERFAQRVFTEQERDYCERMTRPAMHYAARFAAKEAFAKALGTGFSTETHSKDIEIVRQSSGQPTMELTTKALDAMQSRGGEKVWVSLTHTDRHASAVVVIEGPSTQF